MIQPVPRTLNVCAAGDTRPTVCHVIHALGIGGAEVLVDQMVRRMTSDIRAVVAVLDEVGTIGDRLRRDGFVVEHLHRQPGIDRGCAQRLRAFADRHQASLLHAHQCTPFFQAMLSRGLTGRRPVILTEHGRHYPDLPSRKRTVVNRLLLRKHDRLIGVGHATTQALIENEGLPASRVQTIYNGVDLSAVNQADAAVRMRIRREFGWDESHFVVLLVARLHELKDHQTALRTIDHLRQQVPQARLLLVGEGDQRPHIEQSISSLGLESFVRLAGSREDVAGLLTAADVFLLTSRSEGIPLTVIEAMAAGKPVVATNVGGLSEMIEHQQTGLLAPAGESAQLADCLLQLQRNPGLRDALSSAAAELARKKFSLDTMLQRYREVYWDVLVAAGQLPAGGLP